MPFTSIKLLFRLSIVGICVGLTIIFGFFLIKLVYPLLIGFALAFLIKPIVSIQERLFGFTRSVAVCTSLFGLLLCISGFMTFLVAEIISGSTYLASTIPVHLFSMKESIETLFIMRIFPVFERMMAVFATLDVQQQQTVLSTVKTFTSQLTETISQSIQLVLRAFSHFLLSLPNLASVFIFSLLFAFFISKDWSKLTSLFDSIVPKSVFSRIHAALYDLKDALFAYLRGQLILISITCIIVLFGLLILGIEYPLTTALLIAAVDFIPYLGTGLIFIPWITYGFLTEQHQFATGIAILYCIVLVQRQLFEPRVLSASIGLDPLAMLTSLFVGFQLFHFIGLIIGPVVLILIRTFYRTGLLHDLWFYITDHKEN